MSSWQSLHLVASLLFKQVEVQDNPEGIFCGKMEEDILWEHSVLREWGAFRRSTACWFIIGMIRPLPIQLWAPCLWDHFYSGMDGKWKETIGNYIIHGGKNLGLASWTEKELREFFSILLLLQQWLKHRVLVESVPSSLPLLFLTLMASWRSSPLSLIAAANVNLLCNSAFLNLVESSLWGSAFQTAYISLLSIIGKIHQWNHVSVP